MAPVTSLLISPNHCQLLLAPIVKVGPFIGGEHCVIELITVDIMMNNGMLKEHQWLIHIAQVFGLALKVLNF